MNRPHARFVIVMTLFLAALIFSVPPVLSAEEGNDPGSYAYWLDKGGLFSVYGNQKAAAEAFQKAIDLDPQKSEAYFNAGVVFAEMGEYRKALDTMNRAISLDPENARYYYGRGWIHILQHNRELGLSDMRKAAERNSADARKYIEEIAPRHTGR